MRAVHRVYNIEQCCLDSYACQASVDGVSNGICCPSRLCSFACAAAPHTDILYPAAFISYTAWDQEANLFACQLATALEAEHIQCFFAEVELTAGVKWAPAIRDLASHCKVFVPIISPQYLERPWCLTELHLAMNRHVDGAESVPVLVSGLGLTKHDIIQLTKKPSGDKQQGWLDKWAGMASEVAQNAGLDTLAPSVIAADFATLLDKGLDERLRSPEIVKAVAEQVACRVS